MTPSRNWTLKSSSSPTCRHITRISWTICSKPNNMSKMRWRTGNKSTKSKTQWSNSSKPSPSASINNFYSSTKRVSSFKNPETNSNKKSTSSTKKSNVFSNRSRRRRRRKKVCFSHWNWKVMTFMSHKKKFPNFSRKCFCWSRKYSHRISSWKTSSTSTINIHRKKINWLTNCSTNLLRPTLIFSRLQTSWRRLS